MTGYRLVTCLAAAAVSALAPVPAAALWQSTPIARLTVEGRYDEDLLGRGGGAAGIIAPTLGWRLRKPTVDLQATYGIDVYTYARLLPNAGGENHRLRATETVDLDPRTRLLLTQAAESVYDPTALTRPGVVRAGGEVLFLEGDAEFSRRLTPRLQGALGFGGERSWFSAPEARDGATFAPRATVGWSLTRRDAVNARYRLQMFAFDGAPGWSSHEPTVGYGRLLSRTLHLAFDGGAAIVVGPGGRSLVDPLARAELAFHRPRTELAMSAERALVGAAGLAVPLWSSSASAHGSYRISELLTLSVAIAAFRNDRPGGPLVATGFAAGGGAEYALGEGFAMRLAVRRVAQRGEGEVGVDLSRNIYAAGLAWRFDGPPPR